MHFFKKSFEAPSGASMQPQGTRGSFFLFGPPGGPGVLYINLILTNRLRFYKLIICLVIPLKKKETSQ